MSAAPTSAIDPSILQSILGSLTPTKLQQQPGMSSSPINQFIGQENSANAANAQRGQGILQLLSGQGTAQLAQNQQGYQNQLGQINQDAVSKGLNNTTVVPNLQQGAQNWLNQSNQQVNENTAMNVANMANSFTQQAPNMGLLSSLLGQGGGSAIRPPAAAPGVINPSSMLDGGGGSTPNPQYSWGPGQGMVYGGGGSSSAQAWAPPGMVATGSGGYMPNPYQDNSQFFTPTAAGQSYGMQGAGFNPNSNTNISTPDDQDSILAGLLAGGGTDLSSLGLF